MKNKLLYLITLPMRKIILLTFFSVFTTLSYGQCPDPPAVDSQQFFCSETAWLLIGESADYLSDLQVFPEVPGWTITWYDDNGGVPGSVIANPNTELLVSGTVYHVTQTNTANCESDPLAITVVERDCGCIKDPTFENQNGLPSDRGYTYTQFTGTSNHKTCGQGSMLTAPARARGTTDAITAGNEAVFVTQGIDPTAGVPITRTNPDNPSSTHAFRLNRNGTPTKITSMQKYFIASEVFVFNFALVLQNPTSPVHAFEEMPFAQVNLYDQNNNLIRSRCIISDANDCIFNPTGTILLYSDWSCIKLNTLEYQGQPLRAEFYVADCTLGGHYGYMYLDDIYVGEDNEEICQTPSFGYALLESVSPAGQNCFIPEPAQTIAGCITGFSVNIPGFPLEVCGLYSAPVSQGPPPTLDQITMNIIQNDIIVGTVTNPSPGSDPNSFCFTINETDVNVLPYGEFTFDIEIDFELDCGFPYNFVLDDRSTFNLCPTASCPLPITVCDIDGSGFSNFDLTQVEPDVLGLNWQQGDIIFSYYINEQDAHDAANEIPDPTDFDNTVAGGQTIYIRLDWNIPQLTSACYYLAELHLEINKLADLDHLPDEYVGCGTDFSVTLSGTPSNLPELGSVTYQWFREGVQIPTTGSFYDATTPGEYTVIVSNFGCEVSHTFIVREVDFALDLGQDVVFCDMATYTIEPDIIEGPNQDPIDPNDVTYLWSTGETTPTITVTQSGVYTLEVTYDSCTETGQINVSIGNLEIDMGDNVVLCDVSMGYVLDVAIDGVPQNEVSYLWSTGETSPTITVFDFGIYSVDVDWNGCVETTSIELIEAQAPEITLGENITKCANDEITLQVQFLETPQGNLSYTWFRDGGQLIGSGQSIQVTEFGLYTVVVDNEGCTTEAEVMVEPFETNPNCVITQGISPEGSPGFNDNLDLGFLASRTGIDNLQIFNRHGMLVYDLQNYTNEWIGQSNNGDSLPTGVYFYVINLSGDDPVFGTQTTGTIYINRGMN